MELGQAVSFSWLQALSAGEAAWLALGFGLVIGSFLNVVIHRLPRMMEAEWARHAAEMSDEPLPDTGRYNLLKPRSHCPACNHPISPLHNVPVLSWLALRGRCAHCSARIPVRYPAVELLSGVLAAAAIWRFGPTAAGAGGMLLGFFLVTLTFIDLDTQLLPDDLTLPLLWIGLIFNLSGTFAAIDDAVIGAMAGYLALWSVYWLFKLVTGKEGMGYGDFKLLAALGAWFGWQAIPSIILLSAVVGAAVGITLVLSRRQGRDVPIPFGPYLAGAGLIALHLGPSVDRLLAIG